MKSESAQRPIFHSRLVAFFLNHTWNLMFFVFFEILTWNPQFDFFFSFWKNEVEALLGEGGGGTGRRDELLNFSLVCLGVRMSTPYDFSFGLGVPPKCFNDFCRARNKARRHGRRLCTGRNRKVWLGSLNPKVKTSGLPLTSKSWSKKYVFFGGWKQDLQ